jgi:hypothetical protein
MFLALLVAAQITTVADAADEKHPLEVDLESEYVHLRTTTTISREGVGDVLSHVRTLDAMNFRIKVGLYHDLELHVIAPLALQDVQTWKPLAGASSLTNNTISISGCAGSLCGPVQPIMLVDGKSERAGFFSPTIGIAWGPINEERERVPNAYATWVLGVDYTAPLGNRVDDPSRWGFNTSPGTGSELRKAHVITPWTAFSKRFQVLEPYFRVAASLPFAAKGAYDNCSHPAQLSDVAAANCAAQWAGQTGYQPPFEGMGTLGAELVAAEAEDRKLSFDVRGDLIWHSQQRGYTQVADALGKLTFADEYVTGQGSLGVYGRVARWLQLRVYGVLGVETAHFLTHEEVGNDYDKQPGINVSEGTGVPAPDQNPNYDWRLDQVGRRLRAEPAMYWGVSGTLSLNF